MNNEIKTWNEMNGFEKFNAITGGVMFVVCYLVGLYIVAQKVGDFIGGFIGRLLTKEKASSEETIIVSSEKEEV